MSGSRTSSANIYLMTCSHRGQFAVKETNKMMGERRKMHLHTSEDMQRGNSHKLGRSLLH